MGDEQTRTILIAIVGAAVIVVGAIAALLTGAVKLPPDIAASLNFQASICQADGEIAPATRGAVTHAADDFARALLSDDPSSAQPLMTDKAQTAVIAQALKTKIAVIVKRFRPFSQAKITHLFYVTDALRNGTTICNASDGRVAVAVVHGAQAHVLMRVESGDTGFALALWLVPAKDAWRVRYFHINIAAAAGRDARALLAEARQERDTGHIFNATLLYAAARDFAGLGEGMQLPISTEIGADMARLNVPEDLKARPPPIEWTMEGKTYVIGSLLVEGYGKDLALEFTLPQDDWPDNKTVDARNREFIDAFIAVHPDYGRSFGALITHAVKPDKSGVLTTLYRRDKGYD